MLSEKEYLLLCEFIGMQGTWGESDSFRAAALSMKEQHSSSSLVAEMTVNPRLDLKVKKIMKKAEVTVYIIDDNCGDICIVCASKNKEYKAMSSEESNSLIDFIKDNMLEKGILTAVGPGGIYAGVLAELLDMEAVVFAAPGNYELAGNIKNFTGEYEPVGDYTEKIIFLKQKLPEENIYETLYETLLLDEGGNVVICEQSEYSKFLSWFYNSAGRINDQVWGIFFNDGNEENIFTDNDLFSIYLRVEELSLEKIQNSLEKTIRYIDNELSKNMVKLFDKSIFSLPYEDFERQIRRFVHKTTLNASEVVKDIFDSARTILMGISVFAIEKNYAPNELINKFSQNIDEILQSHGERLVNLLENQKRIHIDSLCNLPELFHINN